MESYKIKNKEDLLSLLSITNNELLNALNNKSNAYIKYKKSSVRGTRIIHSINNEHTIYYLQKKLNNNLFNKFLYPDCVFGFRKNKSYFDFLTPHILTTKKRYYLRLDISNFFDSISILDINEALSYYLDDSIAYDESEEILQTIIDIITLDDKVIQGAITSPAISNLIFRSLDIRIEKYCKKFGIKYTRYADDMLFSAPMSYVHNYKFTNAIKSIIADKNFELNFKKTLKYKNEISLNGYIVGTDIRLSRKKYKTINKIIYNMSLNSFTGFSNRRAMYITKNKLAGYRSYLIQTFRYIDDKNQVMKIEKKIQIIENLICKYCIEHP